MIKALYISHESYEVAGSTLSLVNHLHALRDDVDPLLVLPADGPAADYLRSKDYEVLIVPFKLNISPSRLVWLKRLPRTIRDTYVNTCACQIIAPIIIERSIQLIHTNSSVTLFGHQLAQHIQRCHHRHIPHVWHLREFQDLDFGFTPFCGWQRLRYYINQSDAVIAITRSILNHFRLSEEVNAYVVNDAVCSVKDITVQHKEKNLVFCGKLIPEKGAELALDIFLEVLNSHPDYSMTYLGRPEDPAYLQRLKDKAKNCGVAFKVKFLGFQDDVKSIIEHAAVLLMCSNNEAQGRVTVEAMFFGTPVVALAAGGTLEIIDNEKNGLLFTNIHEGAVQVCRLLDNPILCQTLVANAQQTARSRFSEEQYGYRLLNIYHTILNKNPN